MAILTNPILGDLSGSISGLTFYKTSNGQIIRSRVRPVLSRSIAQSQARSQMINSISGWNQLGLIDKSNFAAFGHTSYHSIHSNRVALYNGIQTYRGLMNNVHNANSHICATTWSLIPGPGVVAHSTNTFSQIVVPTGNCVTAQIKSSAGVYYPITFVSAILNNFYALTITLAWSGIPIPYLVAQQMQDSSGMPIAFFVYSSEQGNSNGFIPKNYLSSLIYNTGIPVFTPPGITGTTGITFAGTNIDAQTNHKQGLLTGKWIWISVYVMGNNATQQFIGRGCIQVT